MDGFIVYSKYAGWMTKLTLYGTVTDNTPVKRCYTTIKTCVVLFPFCNEFCYIFF
jgi:hypothetical protein